MNPEITTLKIPKNLLKSASTDKTRPVLQDAYIDTEARAIVCTNGRVLTKIPIPGAGKVKKCRITPQDLKIAKALDAKNLIFDWHAGTLNGHPLENGGECPMNFPAWQQVIPREKPQFRVSFNPHLLQDIIESLGGNDIGKITMEFSEVTDQKSPPPMMIKFGESIGILMPMSCEEPVGILQKIKAPKEQETPQEKIEETPIDSGAGEHSPTNEAPPFRDPTEEPAEKPSATKPKKAKEAAPEKQPKKPRKQSPLATAPPILTRNQERNGIELRFNGRPDDITRERMKAAGFRYYFAQEGRPWCATYTEERLILAQSIAEMPANPATDQPEISQKKKVLIVPDF